MEEPTQEQWVELLQWCGFRHFIETKYNRAVDMWEYPKPYGVKRNRSYLPPIDLNSLFEYVVPKVRERLGDIRLFNLLRDWVSQIAFDCENPALALFWIFKEASNE